MREVDNFIAVQKIYLTKIISRFILNKYSFIVKERNYSMSRSPEKNKKIREESINKIRKAALEVFSNKGFSASRIQDIAIEAKISQGLLYRYYSSKEEIFADLISDSLDKMSESALYVKNMEGTFEKKLEFAIKNLIKSINEKDNFGKTSRLVLQGVAAAKISDEVKNMLKRKMDIPYGIMAEFMEEGQTSGEIIDGDPYDLSVIFWSMVNGFVLFQNNRDNSSKLPNYNTVKYMFLRK
jgi:AcrR family transcriptional regulator